jgi:hypothetical protein
VLSVFKECAFNDESHKDRLKAAPLYISAVQTIEGGALTTPSHKNLQLAAVLSAMGSAQATSPRWASGSSRFDV